MSNEARSASRSGRPRGVRLALVTCGLVVLAVLAALSVMGIITLFEQGHPLSAAFLAMAPLLLLLLGARIIALNWQGGGSSTGPPNAPPEGNDPTGNWGVGGPSMREPGSTGVWPARHVDRRYEERDD
jgi:hypothetical protein